MEHLLKSRNLLGATGILYFNHTIHKFTLCKHKLLNNKSLSRFISTLLHILDHPPAKKWQTKHFTLTRWASHLSLVVAFKENDVAHIRRHILREYLNRCEAF